MSYCRIGEDGSDFYIYSDGDHIHVYGGAVSGEWPVGSERELIDVLRGQEAAGYTVPGYVFARLEAEADGHRYETPVQRALAALKEDGPEQGHTFQLVVSSRGSYGVVGEQGHTDADYFSDPWVIEVRAWSLPAALRKAAELPLSAWKLPIGEEETEGDRKEHQ